MHSHSHEHHDHGHIPNQNFGRAFAIGILLNIGFVVVEWVYGVMAHSLALVADASHNFSDVVGLILAWGALALARKPPSLRFTYGLRGSTILAALGNAMLLLVASGGIAWEAILRFETPSPVNETMVIWVAVIGVVINAATAMLFMSGRRADLNIRGAYLHMAADAGVSLGVVLAGLTIRFTGWVWLDPAVSLAIIAVILVGTWGLLRDSVSLALHAAPSNVDPIAVRRYLAGLPGVKEVHDLHIWGMSTTETALTAHLVMPDGYPSDDFLTGTTAEIEHKFHIGHATIQVETGIASKPCALAPENVV